jgi:hypothetical protein
VKRHLLLMAVVLPLAVSAQTIWRCGPDGRTYSATPCAEGRALEGLQPRPADEVAEARDRAAQERQQAETMTQARLAQETRQRGNGPAAIGTPELKAVAAKPQRQRAKKSRSRAEEAGTWRATAPSTRRTKG